MKYMMLWLTLALMACEDAVDKTATQTQADSENPLLKLQNDAVKKVETDIGEAMDKTQEALDSIDKP
ncbi:MAG: hypothetical protein Q4D61_02355 [Cardiobacteriaceae bacterium]|nr:hypothetical protein [Cardiobacteriaceae bacterium]